MRAAFGGGVTVSESRSRRDGTLRYVRYTVHVRRAEMMLTVPMHRRALRVQ